MSEQPVGPSAAEQAQESGRQDAADALASMERTVADRKRAGDVEEADQPTGMLPQIFAASEPIGSAVRQ